MAQVKLKNVRLAFPDLYIARPFKAGDKPKFKATFLIEKGSEQDKEVQKAILEAAKASKWGSKAKETLDSIKGNPNKYCYQDGNTKSYDGYKGMMALSASNVARPPVFDRDKTPLNQEDGKPYGGCYVNANVDIFGYSNSGSGISASLAGVQFVKDGEPFSGSALATAEDFEEVDSDDDDLV